MVFSSPPGPRPCAAGRPMRGNPAPGFCHWAAPRWASAATCIHVLHGRYWGCEMCKRVCGRQNAVPDFCRWAAPGWASAATWDCVCEKCVGCVRQNSGPVLHCWAACRWASAATCVQSKHMRQQHKGKLVQAFWWQRPTVRSSSHFKPQGAANESQAAAINQRVSM